jgi:hypothetical protein
LTVADEAGKWSPKSMLLTLQNLHVEVSFPLDGEKSGQG